MYASSCGTSVESSYWSCWSAMVYAVVEAGGTEGREMGSTRRQGRVTLPATGELRQVTRLVTRPPSRSLLPPSTSDIIFSREEMSKSQSAAQQALALLDDLDFSVDDVPQEALDQPHQQANEAEDALQFLNGPSFSALSLSLSLGARGELTVPAAALARDRNLGSLVLPSPYLAPQPARHSARPPFSISPLPVRRPDPEVIDHLAPSNQLVNPRSSRCSSRS